VFSNEQPSNLRRTHGDSPKSGLPVQEITLLRQEILIERKGFSLALKENLRGRFIRIVESNGNYFLSIIIPANGLLAFQKLLDDMIRADNEIPPKHKNHAPV
jgi:PurA-like ssDNA and RNA-binding protein